MTLFFLIKGIIIVKITVKLSMVIFQSQKGSTSKKVWKTSDLKDKVILQTEIIWLRGNRDHRQALVDMVRYHTRQVSNCQHFKRLHYTITSEGHKTHTYVQLSHTIRHGMMICLQHTKTHGQFCFCMN
jgi:hypothetical protein